jgi:hypothetical protein
MTAELAELNLVGVVIHAIGNLNLNDSAAALKTLMRGLDLYLEAQKAEVARKQNQSENAVKEAA